MANRPEANTLNWVLYVCNRAWSFACVMDKTVLTTVGQRIKYFRERKDWDQTQLWKAIGMKQSRLSKVENDKGHPYYWELERIAFYTEVPLCCFDTLRYTVWVQSKHDYTLRSVQSAHAPMNPLVQGSGQHMHP